MKRFTARRYWRRSKMRSGSGFSINSPITARRIRPRACIRSGKRSASAGDFRRCDDGTEGGLYSQQSRSAGDWWPRRSIGGIRRHMSGWWGQSQYFGVTSGNREGAQWSCASIAFPNGVWERGAGGQRRGCEMNRETRVLRTAVSKDGTGKAAPNLIDGRRREPYTCKRGSNLYEPPPGYLSPRVLGFARADGGGAGWSGAGPMMRGPGRRLGR